jgi:chromate reductase
LRPNSSNLAILHGIAALAPHRFTYEFYNGLTDLPHFNPATDTDTPPPSVLTLRESIRSAEGIIICTPEYAFGVPGSLKNALDWMVSTVLLTDKPTALITASSSGDKAHASLLQTLSALSVNVIPQTSLLIPFIKTKVSVNGVIDNETKAELTNVLNALAELIGK